MIRNGRVVMYFVAVAFFGSLTRTVRTACPVGGKLALTTLCMSILPVDVYRVTLVI